METANAELGSLCVVSTTADLELQLNSLARFATNDSDFTVEELIQKTLGCHSLMKPWVSRGDVFKLIINLVLDGTDVDPHSMIQAFSQKLYSSEMWHQLRLKPTTMTLSSHETITIQLSEARDNAHLASERKQHHRLFDNPTGSGIRPHPNVPVLELSSVHLVMRLEEKQETKGPKQSEHGTGSQDGLDLIASVPAVFRRKYRSEEPLPVVLRADMLGSDLRRLPPTDSRVIGDTSFEPLNLKSSSGMSELGQRKVNRSQHDIIAILDAGIRLAITTNPTQLARGIRLEGSDSFKALADIAPSMWSPGYLTAMSSRSLLLPTISHALSQVGIGNAKSAKLKAKLAEVVRRANFHSPLRFQASVLLDQQRLQAAQLLIGSRLWQIAQSSAFDGSAACRLKGLLPSSDVPFEVESADTLELDVVLEANDSDREYEFDCNNMELADSGYAPKDGLLSITETSRPPPPHIGYRSEARFLRSWDSGRVMFAEGPSDMDEDMLYT